MPYIIIMGIVMGQIILQGIDKINTNTDMANISATPHFVILKNGYHINAKQGKNVMTAIIEYAICDIVTHSPFRYLI